jgi:hypothetical protein
MPPHALHLLQPLDVGCLSLLKWAYRREIRVLANSSIKYIDKKAFLASFVKISISPFQRRISSQASEQLAWSHTTQEWCYRSLK